MSGSKQVATACMRQKKRSSMEPNVSTSPSKVLRKLFMTDLSLFQQRPLFVNALDAVIKVFAVSCALKMYNGTLPLI
jgi:hypothetical protein